AAFAVACDARLRVELLAVLRVHGPARGRRRGTSTAEPAASAARAAGLSPADRERLHRAGARENPDAVPARRARADAAARVNDDALLALPLERRDGGVHARVRLELPQRLAVRLVERREPAVVTPDEQ